VSLDEDFVLVPKFVYIPLSKWYGCDKEIERKVIKYKTKDKSFQKKGKIPQLSSIIPEAYKKEDGEYTYELEVYPKFIYYSRINDKGE